MNVLVIGSGGREDAITWKLEQSPLVKQVYVAPGNGSTPTEAPSKSLRVSIAVTDFEAIIKFVKSSSVDLVIVGPEVPLVAGLADTLANNGIKCFGPSKKAAEIEGSKAFSKDFMARHKIPTAPFKTFNKFEDASAYLKTVKATDIVIKASGLAAGKGVVLPETNDEAEAVVKRIMLEKEFGDAGDEVVIEKRLRGQEVSLMAFSDGYTVVPMAPAQDHKRVNDNDQGPNTGGMGAYAPVPFFDDALKDQAVRQVLKPTINGLRKEGRPFRGVLYAGLMVTEEREIFVLEFNCRMGDPETQVVLPLLESDLAEITLACVEGTLDAIDVKWKSDANAVTVVLASGGYPGSYPKGKEITLLPDKAPLRSRNVPGEDVIVFHAGTKLNGTTLITDGGRVLAVTAVDHGVKAAIDKAYRGVQHIHFEGAHYRKDIGGKALAQQQQKASMTYAAAGVDIVAGDALVDRIKPFAKATSRSGCDADLGGFGGLFDLKAAGFVDPVLVSGTDGVGTKLKVAIASNTHNTVGIDLVAMSVNDVVVQGAEPLFFLDYYACGKLHVDTAAQVVQGVANGCIQAGCGLLGGETAEMPGMYHDGDYDLAGFAVGAVERNALLPKPTNVGDILLGLASSGIHSNGYSLVRKLIEIHHLNYNDPAPFQPSSKLAEAILTPTKIYVKSCLAAIKKGGVNALAHITGGGIVENLPRVLPTKGVAAEVDLSTWALPPVFKWLRDLGNLQQQELLRTYNCGIGMILVVSPSQVDEVVKVLQSHNETVFKIGKLVARDAKEEGDAPVLVVNNWQ